MSNVPEDGRRRPYLPQTERQLWRYELFQRIRRESRYQNIIVQDLRPLWKNAIAEIGTDDLDAAGRPIFKRRFFGLMRRASHDTSRPALRAYVDAVAATTTSTLRITNAGTSTLWACEFVHVDVEPRAAAKDGQWAGMAQWSRVWDPEAIPDDSNPWNIMSERITIQVSPTEGRVKRGDGLRELPPWAEWLEPEVTIGPKSIDRFDEWDGLRKAAYAMVDHIINEFQAWYDQEYPQQNPSTRSRFSKDADEFVRHLLERKQPEDRAMTERLRRFGRMIGADYGPHRN